jgi:hypothetical protein
MYRGQDGVKMKVMKFGKDFWLDGMSVQLSEIEFFFQSTIKSKIRNQK